MAPQTMPPQRCFSFPTLRDSKSGWLNFVVLGYGILAYVGGIFLYLQQRHSTSSGSRVISASTIVGILWAAHGKILTSYLVHEAAHANIFLEPWANRWFGVASLWTAGCPYADFGHVKWMHMSHHNDRADTVEFDYRSFVKKGGPVLRYIVLGCEYSYIPAIETIMHLRTATFPILWPDTVKPERHRSALIGAPLLAMLYVWLYGQSCLLPHLISGALVLQYLALNDAFHHTYEAIMMANYVPGPGTRTAQYEEENTYSNLVSVRYPTLNMVFALNFGYHNAHHQKAMTPWYKLPELHDSLYGSIENTPQLLPYVAIFRAWHRHRLQRVLDDDYGVVKKPGTPGRADNFVGALGVSFLTVYNVQLPQHLQEFYIDGQWVAPTNRKTTTINVIDPSFNVPMATITLGSKEDTDAAVQAARRALQRWSHEISLDDRKDYVRRLGEIYKQRYDEMATLISTEMGSPIQQARDGQAGSGLYHIEQALRDVEYYEPETYVPGINPEDASTLILHEPIGVVGMITPWIWPMNQVTLKVIPALLVGCTCILKPSEIAPLSS